jgi:hypothetical protein
MRAMDKFRPALIKWKPRIGYLLLGIFIAHNGWHQSAMELGEGWSSYIWEAIQPPEKKWIGWR